MSETTYQVTLAVDGNHTVSVASDDPAAVTAGLVWAQDTYKQLARLHQNQQTKTAALRSIAKHGEQIESVADLEPEVAPMCGIHDVAMVLVQGRKGPFWSCHEKMPGGEWCSYKPVV